MGSLLDERITKRTVAGSVAACLVGALALAGVGAAFPESAAAAPSNEAPTTESSVEFVEANIDQTYTDAGPLSEQVGDAQQVEAVTSGADELDQDLDAHVARVDLESDIAGVAATWDLGAADPQSVHLRYLEDGTWSEWVDLEFEDLTPRDGGTSPTQAGTEVFLLANAQAAEVVARTSEGYSVPGLRVTVIDAEGLAPVDNSLADIVVDEEENEDALPPAEEQLVEPSDGQESQKQEESASVDSEIPSVEESPSAEDRLLDLEGAYEADGAQAFSGATVETAEHTGSLQFTNASYNADGTIYDTGFHGLKINTRKAWNANESYMTWKREPITIQGAVVHHTQGNYSYTKAQSAAQVRIIYEYHARTLGWGDIGYNLIVDKYGGVWEGRAGGLLNATKGAQAYGANSQTFGISVMGDFSQEAPPTVARQAMSKAIAWKLKVHGITSSTGSIQVPGSANLQAGSSRKITVKTVSGHRDIGGTDCPGNAFYAQMGTVRSEVDSYLKSSTSAPSTAAPAPTSFNAGNVISDKLFYNKDAMSESQIKAFIQDAGKDCKPGSGTTCLKDTKFSTQNLTTLRGGCKPIQMSGNQAPWTIIYKTAQACGINPQVLLVTLQKEQSGLAQPRSAATWAKAMGSGCPDGSGCDSAQGGFMKQIYYGADKLVSYKDRSIAGHVDAFKAGKTLSLRHNPDSACGTENVKFSNVATASLYEYTPYIGNSSKSGCSATGQKMFWTLMQRHFPNAEKQYGDASGATVTTGWVKQGGHWYYFGDSGAPKTGWLKDKDKWYYLDSSGVMATGWVKDKDKWYHLSASGAMNTGWVKDKDKWYHLSASGAMDTGWLKDGTHWYYLSPSGRMQTGWLQLNGRQYYLRENGSMVTGEQIIDGKTYVFANSGRLTS